MNKYYVYSFLREDNHSPYYIGKGCGRRKYRDGGRKGIQAPPRDRIKVIKENLSETDAYKLEALLILMWGRKLDGSGILRNFVEGGASPKAFTGRKHSEETKRKIREGNKRTKSKGVSEETRKRMSEAAKRRAQTPEGRAQLTKNGIDNKNRRDEGGRFIKK